MALLIQLLQDIPEYSQAGGWVGIALAVVALLASAASLLSAKKPDGVSQDDRIENLATRGEYMPLVIGRERIGAVFLWVKPSPQGSSDADGITDGGVPVMGKGRTSNTTQTYRDQGLHGVCVGPVTKLHAIFQNGKKIWQGPITPGSHPSGTSITIPDAEAGDGGTFYVYWGFPNDPEVALLAAAANHGVHAQYPYAFKILWDEKSLGNTRNWPNLEYEVEAPSYNQIASVPASMPQSATDRGITFKEWSDGSLGNVFEGGGFIPAGTNPNTGQAYSENDQAFAFIQQVTSLGNNTWELILGCLSLGNPPFAYYSAPGLGSSAQPNLTTLFRRGNIVALNGATTNITWTYTPGTPRGSLSQISGSWTNKPRYFWILKSEFFAYSSNPPTNRFGDQDGSSNYRLYGYNKITIGFPVYGIDFEYNAPSNSNWPIAAAVKLQDLQGLNPIHILDQLLFTSFPYGAGRDRSLFDPVSIEDAAIRLRTENIRGSYRALDGEDAKSAVAKIMQDVGLFLSFDPLTGLYVFKLLRHNGDPSLLPALPASMSLSTPEVENTQGDRPHDQLVFTIRNRARNYREDTLIISDDGQAMNATVQRGERIDIYVTTDFDSAASMLPRRSQEVLAAQSHIRFELNHAARQFYPGSAFTAEAIIGEPLTLIVTEIKRDPLTGKVIVDSLVDTYDAPPPSSSDYEPVLLESGGGGMPVDAVPQISLVDFDLVEVPRYLSDGKVSFLFPKFRFGLLTSRCLVWLSRDGTSFLLQGESSTFEAGGSLTEALDTSKALVETGPQIFSAHDPDMGQLEDLSSMEESWALGRQVALIGSEICFLKQVVALGDGIWRLDGLLRGRLGTQIQNHPVGTRVYIALSHNLRPMESQLFVANRSLEAKLQPMNRGTVVPLGELQAKTTSIQGKGLKPMDLGGLRLPGFQTVVEVGQDMTFSWCYRSTAGKRTGLGMQGFGDLVGPSAVQGHFLVEIVDEDDEVVRQAKVSAPQYTYTAADRLADELDDLITAWVFRVTQVENGYLSNPLELPINS